MAAGGERSTHSFCVWVGTSSNSSPIIAQVTEQGFTPTREVLDVAEGRTNSPQAYEWVRMRHIPAFPTRGTIRQAFGSNGEHNPTMIAARGQPSSSTRQSERHALLHPSTLLRYFPRQRELEDLQPPDGTNRHSDAMARAIIQAAAADVGMEDTGEPTKHPPDEPSSPPLPRRRPRPPTMTDTPLPGRSLV